MADVVIHKKDDLVISERHIAVVEMYSNGYSTKQIADTFSISHRTVESYLVRLKNKFNCVTTIQLVAEFIRKGLIK